MDASLISAVASGADKMSETLESAYNVWTNERNYSNQVAQTKWDKNYLLASAILSQQNRNDDIGRQERYRMEDMARQDNAWQRAVADIQKSGLSTTMLSSGAGSGTSFSNVGSFNALSSNVKPAQKGKIQLPTGMLLDGLKGVQELENMKNSNDMIKAQTRYYNSMKDKLDVESENDTKRTNAEVGNINARTQGQIQTNSMNALELGDREYYAEQGYDQDGKVTNPLVDLNLKSNIPILDGIYGLLNYGVNNGNRMIGIGARYISNWWKNRKKK